ncbi:hypothetical protein PACILC2_13560 [Paenibacillus cisolokensis]|uniref:Uncharacterized protein n=1 Tax=Paenibacillus cisolokensis TaxID=1658519 RepID=A0ABQ4N3K4_9BACL|nr:hypothetical protein PACILC2_13560 [Paenibacillus cisolokensis]
MKWNTLFGVSGIMVPFMKSLKFRSTHPAKMQKYRKYKVAITVPKTRPNVAREI